VNVHNPPAGTIQAPRRRRSLNAYHGPVGARLLMARWLAGRPRVTSLALAAVGWAATFAAVIASRRLGAGAAVLIIFAATMITCAMVETLLSPAVPVIIEDRAVPTAAGRYKRLGTAALVAGCVLGPAVGGAAAGAGWVTSLLAALAVACAVAGVAAQRLGRRLASGRGHAGPEQPPRAQPVRIGRQIEVDHVRP
jgi:hypothetical protein